jgi:hypothetical protein
MFFNSMPDVRSPRQVEIIRVKAGKPLTMYLTGDSLQVMTHWYKGKSFPCLKPELDECPLCQIGVVQRYYAYYGIRSQDGKPRMLELTSTAEGQLGDCFHKCPRDSVMLVTVGREPGKRNNPIHVSATYKSCSPEELGEIQRVGLDKQLMKRSLIHLWGLPTPNEKTSVHEYYEILNLHIREVINGHV